MTSKCSKNKKAAHEVQPSLFLMCFPHFDVYCDLVLYRCIAASNLFVFLSDMSVMVTSFMVLFSSCIIFLVDSPPPV